MLDAVFEPTLNMITSDFVENPEHRVGFYKLLRSINTNCFPGTFFALDAADARLTDAAISFAHYTPASIQALHGRYHLGYQAHHSRHR
jgi:hypothetical protein